MRDYSIWGGGGGSIFKKRIQCLKERIRKQYVENFQFGRLKESLFGQMMHYVIMMQSTGLDAEYEPLVSDSNAGGGYVYWSRSRLYINNGTY